MLFFTKETLSAIAEIEEMTESELLSEIRLRGMTPGLLLMVIQKIQFH